MKTYQNDTILQEKQCKTGLATNRKKSSSKKGYLKQKREHIVNETLYAIKDVKDYSVLYTAILEDVGILVMGDSDFSDVNVEKPEF